ncbi:MAG: amidohydrolase [Chryseobacterium sp.]|nr:MAG: amidohydrolase [Chryseobacterium sp.]
MKKIYSLAFGFLLVGCAMKNSKQTADLILHNANIYTVDAQFSKARAMAVADGKILAVGSDADILSKYSAKEKTDLEGQTVVPGFIDAHAHFFGYGSSLQQANLRNAKSWDEILQRLSDFAKTHPEGWLLGRGWDQNDWPGKQFPTREKLDAMFPDRPVYLTRIDGHAAIVNTKALQIAGFNENSKISGGDFIKDNGKLSGVLIDNAKDKMSSFIPAPNARQVAQIFREAQDSTFSVGLTTVVDCGLDYDLVETIEKMQKDGELKMRLDVMLGDSQKNIDYLIKRGKIKTPRLQVHGFKFYGDGALGSRGACLLADYSDQKHHRGFMLSDISHFRKMAKIMHDNDFQMNTHAIGDSANRAILEVYADVLKGKNDRRWRIEHAQIVDKNDFDLFGKYSIVPSVQPTHATSDMYWAGERLGAQRLKYAYAYEDLLKQNGWLPLGTDFPIEEIDPMLTFYAAVVRKDFKGYPANGFQTENALTREQALRGMTIWAAKGSFQENEKGSLERGKFADFVILNQDLMTVPADQLLKTKVLATYLNGEKVYQR